MMICSRFRNSFFATLLLALSFTCPPPAVSGGTIGAEFPISPPGSTELALNWAFDGTNYLVAIQGDSAFPANISAQLIDQIGTPIGPRISIGRTGGLPAVAFDGNNYLLVWEDDVGVWPDNDIYGQFISPAGTLVGSPFPVSTAPGRQELEFGGASVVFDGVNYLIIWTDWRLDIGGAGPWYVYGQFVAPDGTLAGGEMQISSTPGHIPSLAYDGTNYLSVWVEDSLNTDYYGQFISPAGAFVGSNFVIDANGLPSDNPTNMFYDGSRYVLTVTDFIIDSGQGSIWGNFVRFIAPNGTVDPQRVSIYEGTYGFGITVNAFDGNTYLVALSEGCCGIPPFTQKVRFYNAGFNPVSDWIPVAYTKNGTVPMGPFFDYDGSRYFGLMTRLTDLYSYSGEIAGMFVEVPHLPDLKANGSDGPLNITLADNLSLTASLTRGGYTGNADWWMLASTPAGWYRYNVATGSWIPGQAVSYQGPLSNLGPYPVANRTLPVTGRYTFYFGVDENVNGTTDQPLFYDTAIVNVSP